MLLPHHGSDPDCVGFAVHGGYIGPVSVRLELVDVLVVKDDVKVDDEEIIVAGSVVLEAYRPQIDETVSRDWLTR